MKVLMTEPTKDEDGEFRDTTADWLIEEAVELASAESRSAELDAVFDALGVLLVRLTSVSVNEVSEAYSAYCKAQEARGRRMDSPHQVLIRAAVKQIVHTNGASSRSEEILRGRATRHPGPARRAFLAGIVQAGLAWKAKRKPDPKEKTR